jgi:hypothetical protein
VTNIEEHRAIETSALTLIVRQVLQRPAAEVQTWTVTPIIGGGGNLDGGFVEVLRIAGTADDAGTMPNNSGDGR